VNLSTSIMMGVFKFNNSILPLWDIKQDCESNQAEW